MSKLAAALAGQTRRPSVRCSIAVLLDSLDDLDRKALQNAFADPKMESSLIYRALETEGHDIGIGAVNRHRRKDCRCDAQ